MVVREGQYGLADMELHQEAGDVGSAPSSASDLLCNSGQVTSPACGSGFSPRTLCLLRLSAGVRAVSYAQLPDIPIQKNIVVSFPVLAEQTGPFPFKTLWVRVQRF